MDKEYKATYEFLFDKEENLFYRDHRYFDMKESNGAKVFWGRGNGWVLGGLVEMLRELPAKSKYRPFYQELFQKLCYRIANLQSSDRVLACKSARSGRLSISQKQAIAVSSYMPLPMD